MFVSVHPSSTTTRYIYEPRSCENWERRTKNSDEGTSKWGFPTTFKYSPDSQHSEGYHALHCRKLPCSHPNARPKSHQHGPQIDFASSLFTPNHPMLESVIRQHGCNQEPKQMSPHMPTHASSTEYQALNQYHSNYQTLPPSKISQLYPNALPSAKPLKMKPESAYRISYAYSSPLQFSRASQASINLQTRDPKHPNIWFTPIHPQTWWSPITEPKNFSLSGAQKLKQETGEKERHQLPATSPVRLWNISANRYLLWQTLDNVA